VQKKRGSFPISAPGPTYSMKNFILYLSGDHCHQSITIDDGMMAS